MQREDVANGELPSSTNAELLADALLGPIVMRRLPPTPSL
jgi:hypothetical protein